MSYSQAWHCQPTETLAQEQLNLRYFSAGGGNSCTGAIKKFLSSLERVQMKKFFPLLKKNFTEVTHFGLQPACMLSKL